MSHEYQVRINGCTMDAYRSEQSAIKAAKGYEDETASVVFRSTSGSEVSTMQVWPTRGPMYSMHR